MNPPNNKPRLITNNPNSPNYDNNIPVGFIYWAYDCIDETENDWQDDDGDEHIPDENDFD